MNLRTNERTNERKNQSSSGDGELSLSLSLSLCLACACLTGKYQSVNLIVVTVQPGMEWDQYGYGLHINWYTMESMTWCCVMLLYLNYGVH